MQISVDKKYVNCHKKPKRLAILGKQKGRFCQVYGRLPAHLELQWIVYALNYIYWITDTQIMNEWQKQYTDVVRVKIAQKGGTYVHIFEQKSWI